MAFPLTAEQRAAVENRGGAVLVSAAAGSGKTRVLVERLLNRVSEQGADIDRFLVITYTKAAAAELRGRIALELSERLAQNPSNRHLRKQTTLIYRTQISTVHAFCAGLLREHAAELDIDPDFRLCDEGEASVLMNQALSRLMDSRYEQLGPESDFARLVDTMSAGRDDSRLMQIVLDVFHRIQSHPDPGTWLKEQEELWALDGVDDIARTAWGAVLMEQAGQQAAYCLERLELARNLCDGDAVLAANYGDSLQQSIDALRHLIQVNSWDAACQCLPIPFPTAGRKRGVEDVRAAERVKSIRDRAKKQLEKLGEWFEGESAQLLHDLRCAGPAVRALMVLVRDFEREYGQEKKRRGVVDFSDLEHMAVKLLLDANGQPTELARSWSARYDEIMVDEFQDTNQVQNAIFHALAGSGGELFMVGDVKQSIYRFRLADPTIFLDYYRTFKDAAQAQPGECRKLVLSRNFRSRPQVLEGVNDLFRELMSEQFGEIDYTDDQALVPGAGFPEPGDWRVELNVVDAGEQEEEGEEQEDKNLLEARCAAWRIRCLLDEPMPVTQGDGVRPVRAEDVMILLRSPGPVLHHYIRALSEQNIPWSADTGEDFFSFTEVNVALALLRIVDNPHQDVPLIAALRSPVYGFSADRLAWLRSLSRGDFFAAVQQAAGQGEQDCADFLRDLDELRLGAGERSCSQLIWHIYECTDLLGLFSAMPEGEGRRARLLTLYELARQQEGAGCHTLFDFLLRLDRLRANGQRISTGGGAGNAGGVRILSIHRSKGLEAPVVLVCGLARRFNREDMYQPVLFHPKLGIGPKYLDQERHIELNTIARRAVAHVLEREMLAEELRLLYVAMTRAREKLILSMSMPRLHHVLASMREDLDTPLPSQVLAGCPCVGHWILMSVMCRRSGQPLRELIGLEAPAERDYTYGWNVQVVGAERLGENVRGPVRKRAALSEGVNEMELEACLRWQYEHSAAAQIPSKITATQLKGRLLDHEAAQQTGQISAEERVPLYRPQFAAEKLGLTPAQRGTALHLAMQYLDFGVGDSREQIEAGLRSLVEGEFLTPQQAGSVDPERLAAFFRSELGVEMARSQLHREFKFSLLTDAGEYFSGVEGEQLLLQGVVDCWFETEQGITVVDFKTDRVTQQTVKERAQAYQPQIAAYARALSEITGRPVTRRVLWFFAVDSAVEV